jgi:hypothetical protein
MAAAAATVTTFSPTWALTELPNRILILTVDGQRLVQEGLAAMNGEVQDV